MWYLVSNNIIAIASSKIIQILSNQGVRKTKGLRGGVHTEYVPKGIL